MPSSNCSWPVTVPGPPQHARLCHGSDYAFPPQHSLLNVSLATMSEQLSDTTMSSEQMSNVVKLEYDRHNEYWLQHSQVDNDQPGSGVEHCDENSKQEDSAAVCKLIFHCSKSADIDYIPSISSSSFEPMDDIPTISAAMDDNPTIFIAMDTSSAISATMNDVPTIAAVINDIPTRTASITGRSNGSTVMHYIPTTSAIVDGIPTISAVMDDAPNYGMATVMDGISTTSTAIGGISTSSGETNDISTNLSTPAIMDILPPNPAIKRECGVNVNGEVSDASTRYFGSDQLDDSVIHYFIQDGHMIEFEVDRSCSTEDDLALSDPSNEAGLPVFSKKKPGRPGHGYEAPSKREREIPKQITVCLSDSISGPVTKRKRGRPRKLVKRKCGRVGGMRNTYLHRTCDQLPISENKLAYRFSEGICGTEKNSSHCMTKMKPLSCVPMKKKKHGFLKKPERLLRNRKGEVEKGIALKKLKCSNSKTKTNSKEITVVNTKGLLGRNKKSDIQTDLSFSGDTCELERNSHSHTDGNVRLPLTNNKRGRPPKSKNILVHDGACVLSPDVEEGMTLRQPKGNTSMGQLHSEGSPLTVRNRTLKLEATADFCMFSSMKYVTETNSDLCMGDNMLPCSLKIEQSRAQHSEPGNDSFTVPALCEYETEISSSSTGEHKLLPGSKRKRGRPPKSENKKVSSFSGVACNIKKLSHNGTVGNGLLPVAKRKRGRPRKSNNKLNSSFSGSTCNLERIASIDNGTGEDNMVPMAKRKRGRPRKSKSISLHRSEENEVESVSKSQRIRSRSQEFETKQDSSCSGDTCDLEKLSHNGTGEDNLLPVARKKRGRPRKSENNPNSSFSGSTCDLGRIAYVGSGEENLLPVAKPIRGRPRKSLNNTNHLSEENEVEQLAKSQSLCERHQEFESKQYSSCSGDTCYLEKLSHIGISKNKLLLVAKTKLGRPRESENKPNSSFSGSTCNLLRISRVDSGEDNLLLVAKKKPGRPRKSNSISLHLSEENEVEPVAMSQRIRSRSQEFETKQDSSFSGDTCDLEKLSHIGISKNKLLLVAKSKLDRPRESENKPNSSFSGSTCSLERIASIDSGEDNMLPVAKRKRGRPRKSNSISLHRSEENEVEPVSKSQRIRSRSQEFETKQDSSCSGDTCDLEKRSHNGTGEDTLLPVAKKKRGRPRESENKPNSSFSGSTCNLRRISRVDSGEDNMLLVAKKKPGRPRKSKSISLHLSEENEVESVSKSQRIRSRSQEFETKQDSSCSGDTCDLEKLSHNGTGEDNLLPVARKKRGRPRKLENNPNSSFSSSTCDLGRIAYVGSGEENLLPVPKPKCGRPRKSINNTNHLSEENKVEQLAKSQSLCERHQEFETKQDSSCSGDTCDLEKLSHIGISKNKLLLVAISKLDRPWESENKPNSSFSGSTCNLLRISRVDSGEDNMVPVAKKKPGRPRKSTSISLHRSEENEVEPVAMSQRIRSRSQEFETKQDSSCSGDTCDLEKRSHNGTGEDNLLPVARKKRGRPRESENKPNSSFSGSTCNLGRISRVDSGEDKLLLVAKRKPCRPRKSTSISLHLSEENEVESVSKSQRIRSRSQEFETKQDSSFSGDTCDLEKLSHNGTGEDNLLPVARKKRGRPRKSENNPNSSFSSSTCDLGRIAYVGSGEENLLPVPKPKCGRPRKSINNTNHLSEENEIEQLTKTQCLIERHQEFESKQYSSCSGDTCNLEKLSHNGISKNKLLPVAKRIHDRPRKTVTNLSSSLTKREARDTEKNSRSCTGGKKYNWFGKIKSETHIHRDHSPLAWTKAKICKTITLGDNPSSHLSGIGDDACDIEMISNLCTGENRPFPKTKRKNVRPMNLKQISNSLKEGSTCEIDVSIAGGIALRHAERSPSMNSENQPVTRRTINPAKPSKPGTKANCSFSGDTCDREKILHAETGENDLLAVAQKKRGRPRKSNNISNCLSAEHGEKTVANSKTIFTRLQESESKQDSYCSGDTCDLEKLSHNGTVVGTVLPVAKRKRGRPRKSESQPNSSFSGGRCDFGRTVLVGTGEDDLLPVGKGKRGRPRKSNSISNHFAEENEVKPAAMSQNICDKHQECENKQDSFFSGNTCDLEKLSYIGTGEDTLLIVPKKKRGRPRKSENKPNSSFTGSACNFERTVLVGTGEDDLLPLAKVKRGRPRKTNSISNHFAEENKLKPIAMSQNICDRYQEYENKQDSSFSGNTCDLEKLSHNGTGEDTLLIVAKTKRGRPRKSENKPNYSRSGGNTLFPKAIRKRGRPRRLKQMSSSLKGGATCEVNVGISEGLVLSHAETHSSLNIEDQPVMRRTTNPAKPSKSATKTTWSFRGGTRKPVHVEEHDKKKHTSRIGHDHYQHQQKPSRKPRKGRVGRTRRGAQKVRPKLEGVQLTPQQMVQEEEMLVGRLSGFEHDHANCSKKNQ